MSVDAKDGRWPERAAPDDGTGPLQGVRVLDLTAYAVGPWAGSLLAQLGADVIRVNPPAGDPIRGVMPTKGGEPTTYMTSNLGKRSIVLDLKSAEGHDAAVRLAAGADVVIDNSRAGTMERLGLGYDQLRAVNPQLVYCSSSSFGDGGPLLSMGSTDPQGQAFSGFASLNGAPGEGPEVLRYVALIDLSTSMYLAQSVLIGLHARRRSGTGLYIRTSQMEASIAVQTTRLAEFLASGAAPQPRGSGTDVLVPSGAFLCQDGAYVAVTAHTESAWRALCDILGLPALINDDRLASNAGRVEHRAEVERELAAAFATRPALWWTQALGRAGVPCVRPRTLEDDPEFQAHFVDNGFVRRVPHPVSGTLLIGGPPWRFEKSAVRTGRPTLPGADDAEVLAATPAAPAAPSVARGERDTVAAADEHALPLDGVRVIDISQGISGPYCSLLLQAAGAEVVKVEPPTGDWLRAVGPPWIDGVGAAAYQLNRGKASVSLDLDSQAGVDALLRLAAEADVLIHDLTIDEARARGLTPGDLRRVNPRLVDVSVTALGETGPWASIAATELEVQSLSGLHRYLGAVGAPPVRLGADVGGILGGCAAMHAALAGLLARDDVGGQHAAVSQLGALMAINTVMIAALDEPDEWQGFHCHAATYPSDRGIPTRDGRVYYGPPLRSEDAWRAFCVELGAEHLLEDPRFATRAARMPHQADLRRALEPYFRELDTDEVIERVVRGDGIAVPVNDHADLVEHPQVQAMGIVVDGENACALAPPWRRSGSAFPPVTGAAPAVGDDTESVLLDAGLDEAEIRDLVVAAEMRTEVAERVTHR